MNILCTDYKLIDMGSKRCLYRNYGITTYFIEPLKFFLQNTSRLSNLNQPLSLHHKISSLCTHHTARQQSYC
jgi:hypothetical protein